MLVNSSNTYVIDSDYGFFDGEEFNTIVEAEEAMEKMNFVNDYTDGLDNTEYSNLECPECKVYLRKKDESEEYLKNFYTKPIFYNVIDIETKGGKYYVKNYQ